MGSHGDPHLLNIYVDEALEIVMPINWAPPGAQFNEWGVIENCSVEGPEGYRTFLSKNIPKRFKCESVASILRSLSAGNISCCKSEIFLTQNRLFTQIESEKCDMLEERSTR